MDNITPSANSGTHSTQKASFLKKILNSAAFIPLVFFITSISLWGAFISKVYYEKKSNTIIEALSYRGPEQAPLSKKHEQGLVEGLADDSEALMIKELTNQLAKQKQQNTFLEQQLEIQQSQFDTMIEESTKAANPANIAYLNALNKKNTNKIFAEKKGSFLTNIDYYNRVSPDSSNQRPSTLQRKFDQLMKSKPKKSSSNYVKKINKESDARQNAVRSIVLKRGESIWMIAERAYGNGFQYHKIMTANPQITEKNARFLKPGTRIRVPI